MVLAIVPAVLAISGCSAMSVLLHPKVDSCSGFDMPVASLRSVRKQLHVRVKARRVDVDFPIAVESAPDSFVMVGFTPLGTKSFTLTRHGETVDVENLLGIGETVPPRNLMADVLAMSVPTACSPTQDGPTPTAAGQWQIVENCKDGRPLDRALRRATAKADDKPEIEVVYGDDAILVRQKECGYNARYVLESAPLPQVQAGAPLPAAGAPGPASAATPAPAATSTPAPPAAAAPSTAPPATAAPAPSTATTPSSPAAPAPTSTGAPVETPAVSPPPATPKKPKTLKDVFRRHDAEESTPAPAAPAATPTPVEVPPPTSQVSTTPAEAPPPVTPAPATPRKPKTLKDLFRRHDAEDSTSAPVAPPPAETPATPATPGTAPAPSPATTAPAPVTPPSATPPPPAN